jgi:hypothetical protein
LYRYVPPQAPAPAPEPPRPSHKKSHKKKQPQAPQPGERVAANIGEVTAGAGAQEWIVAVVVQYLPNERAYEVGGLCTSCCCVQVVNPVVTRSFETTGLYTLKLRGCTS